MSDEKPIITVDDAHKWVESAIRHIDKAKKSCAEYNRCVAKMERNDIKNAAIMEENHRRLAAQDDIIKSRNRIAWVTWTIEFSALAYIAWMVTK
jgi:vacuolar-type H+-ATPase subunit E/Vma4